MEQSADHKAALAALNAYSQAVIGLDFDELDQVDREDVIAGCIRAIAAAGKDFGHEQAALSGAQAIVSTDLARRPSKAFHKDQRLYFRRDIQP